MVPEWRRNVKLIIAVRVVYGSFFLHMAFGRMLPQNGLVPEISTIEEYAYLCISCA
jgi:hypothetical protein